MWYSGGLSGAVVFVIHSVSVLDAELAFTAQGSLYGETRALHRQTGSITVLLGDQSTLVPVASAARRPMVIITHTLTGLMDLLV